MAHETVRALLAAYSDLHFQDLRVLFQLPHPVIDEKVGCNFAVTALLFNQISAFSRWLYHNRWAKGIESLEAKSKGRSMSGARFKGFIRAYLPHQPDDLPLRSVADRLYDLRNLLAHDLGYESAPRKPTRRLREILIGKPSTPLSRQRIAELETSETRPTGVSLLTRDGLTYTLHTQVLYWATHRMLCEALRRHGDAAEKQAKDYFATLPARVHPRLVASSRRSP